MDEILKVIERNKQVRREFERNKPMYWKILGRICGYCKEAPAVQIDHKIPIENGGDNRIENLWPLCAKHHDMKHGCTGMLTSGRYLGRPKNTPVQGYKVILWQYITGAMIMDQAKYELKLRDGQRITDQWYYKDYIKQLGIKKIKRGGDKRGSTALIQYEDGRIIEYINGECNSQRRSYDK